MLLNYTKKKIHFTELSIGFRLPLPSPICCNHYALVSIKLKVISQVSLVALTLITTKTLQSMCGLFVIFVCDFQAVLEVL